MEASSSGWNDCVHGKKIIKESSVKDFLQNPHKFYAFIIRYYNLLSIQAALPESFASFPLLWGGKLGVLCSSALESGKICCFTWVSCETK